MRATSVFLLLAMVAVAATTIRAQEDVGMDLSMLDIYQSMPVDLPTRPAAEFAALHHAAGEEADAAIREAQRALPSYGGAHLLDLEALEDESSLLEAGAAVGALNGLRSKWDASVPDIVLKTAAPVDEMIHQLELVDQLESHRPELTASAQMAAAFPRGPSVLGEEAAPSSFVQTQSHSQNQVQNQAQAQTQQQFQVQAQQGLGQGQAQQMQASMYTNAQGQQMLVVATEARSVAEAAVDHSAEAETEAETDADADADADADSTTLTDAEAAAGVVTMSELKQMMELQGMSSQEIDAYMASLGESEVEVSVDAEAETEGEAEAETEAETETDAESRAAADADAVAEAEAEALLNSQTDAEFETESGSESHADAESETEGEVSMSAEAEQALAAQAEQDAVMEAEQYSQLETETEAETEAEAETEVEAEADAETENGAEAESEAESESESSVSDDEVVPLHSRAAPEHLAEFAPSTPTPMHSPAFERMHPALRKIAPAQSGYGVLPAFIQTGSESHSTAHAQAHAHAHARAHARAQAQAHAQAQAQAYAHAQQEESDAQFNPSAVQLGPSHDAYGYQPMTGSEFLQAQNVQPSLAQVSMQYGSPRASAWLPPAPLAEQQVPLYVVGPGGLQPNLRAGPYAGQYGVGSNGQAVQQDPRYAEY